MADQDDAAAGAFLDAIFARAADQLGGDESVWNEDVERYGPVTGGMYGSPDGWSHERQYSEGVVGSWTPVTFTKGVRVDVHIVGGFEGHPVPPASGAPVVPVFEPGPDDVIDAGEVVASVDDLEFVDVPEVGPDAAPVRRPADVRPAEPVPVRRDSRLWSEGWRPMRWPR